MKKFLHTMLLSAILCTPSLAMSAAGDEAEYGPQSTGERVVENRWNDPQKRLDVEKEALIIVGGTRANGMPYVTDKDVEGYESIKKLRGKIAVEDRQAEDLVTLWRQSLARAKEEGLDYTQLPKWTKENLSYSDYSDQLRSTLDGLRARKAQEDLSGAVALTADAAAEIAAEMKDQAAANLAHWSALKAEEDKLKAENDVGAQARALEEFARQKAARG